MSIKTKLVHQVSRPKGSPTPDNFAFVETTLPEPGPGQIVVENLYLSVDPYMREQMDGGWPLNVPLEGRSIGRVLASRDQDTPEGKLVFHRSGWCTHAVVDAPGARRLPDHAGIPESAYLSALGGTGLSAYVGLTKIAKLQPQETVFISAAAGGVGTVAGQIAHLLGASRVIGSAGSDEKARHLVEQLGFAAAFNYRHGNLAAQLHDAAPDGIDVYFDNVGGEHLEAAIASLRDHGRVAWCGAIAQYSTATPPPAPRNLYEVVGKSLKIEGFLVRNYRHLQGELEDLLVPEIRSGRIRLQEAITVGFDNIVDAFIGMLRGENLGKAIVQISPTRN